MVYMGKPIPIFQKKIIKKKSPKSIYRNIKPRKKTKAALKKELIEHCQKAKEHLEIFNRIPMVGEKLDHLDRAISHLEKCLEERPGNHILRNQLKISREELYALQNSTQKSADNIIEILFSTDLF